MADLSTVARPYAQAAFELAHAAGQLPAWSQFLGLAAVLVTEPQVARLLTLPGADLQKLAAMLTDICREQLPEAALLKDGERSQGANLLKLLVENRRMALLPGIAVAFDALKAEAENMLDVTLTSAAEVSGEQQLRLADTLKQRFGRQIRLKVALDPALIGGARLQVGDRVIDGSVRTGLDKLATALRN
jgi:F-type H+-transporting ATPase subunit delta